MPFERVERNGDRYWREVNVQKPGFHFCPLGYFSGDGIPEDKGEKEGKNLWPEWKSDTE